MNYEIQVNIPMHRERCCDCHRYFSHETGIYRACCGNCAGDRLSAARAEIEALQKTISRLRGVITRKSRK